MEQREEECMAHWEQAAGRYTPSFCYTHRRGGDWLEGGTFLCVCLCVYGFNEMILYHGYSCILCVLTESGDLILPSKQEEWFQLLLGSVLCFPE